MIRLLGITIIYPIIMMLVEMLLHVKSRLQMMDFTISMDFLKLMKLCKLKMDQMQMHGIHPIITTINSNLHRIPKMVLMEEATIMTMMTWTMMIKHPAVVNPPTLKKILIMNPLMVHHPPSSHKYPNYSTTYTEKHLFQDKLIVSPLS